MVEPGSVEAPVSSKGTGTVRGRVLVADDEESMRYFLRRGLVRSGFDVECVADGAKALASFDAHPADAAVLDLKMPGLDGLDVLAQLRAKHPEAVVVMMTAHGTIASAVEAMRRGAIDYVTKPFELDELVLILERALQHRALLRENRELRALVDHRSTFAGLVGQSPPMRNVFQSIEALRGSDATVLIQGESGTGKELVARALHASSQRAAGPFVALHGAALSDNLVDNELFGHVPGAFTGAVSAKRGLIARADGGCLFLDEVGDLPLPTQAKLERFLQEREFVPLGAAEAVRVDVRVIAATNRDLEVAVTRGGFRRELYFRLNVVPIRIPPLRERPEDVPPLIATFVQRLAKQHGCKVQGLSMEATIALTRYAWPGNVRELQNLIERLVVLNPESETIELEDLPDTMNEPSPLVDPALAPRGWQAAVLQFERTYLTDLLRQTAGNVSEAARIAAMSRGHLHRRLARLGIDSGEFRGG
jgi:DNA-binding NtrC family response regulator